MAYGEGSFGEAAFGEGADGGFPPVVGVVGSMGAIETPDTFAAVGTVPVVSIAAVAEPNVLILVIELQMGMLLRPGSNGPPPMPVPAFVDGTNWSDGTSWSDLL